MIEGEENSKLLLFFNMLEEKEKDIVIKMSELLVAKYKRNKAEIVSGNAKKIDGSKPCIR